MSVLPNGDHDRQSFHRFFEHWIVEQNKYLQDLTSASKQHKRAKTNTTIAAESTQTEETRVPDKPHLRPLINRVILNYEKYYQAKSRCAKQDAVVMLTPPWTSALENAFMWIGGWRPSMAFQLLYSKSGLQLEDQIFSFIQGLSIGDLGDLSPRQLVQIDELQERTIREERKITEKMVKHQETVADRSMVQLSHLVTELMGNEEEEGRSTTDGGGLEERVGSVLELKAVGLENILLKADDLRLRTLKAILDILTPIQAVHFLIAASELHLRFHEWGKKEDASQHVTGGGN
ncbi:protein DOG1-like 3 [Juglans regia]|uniref:Protein DOG1-like 3 n=2 Tax=Juglans regia TaxID=51240 RepID=A0A2I4F7Q4_JUGRE|nr:protein DOG1-like 3 [Juglans regia]